MDWQKTEVIINKINALYRSMSLTKEPPTSIERDLMLNYIRTLYEQFIADNNHSSNTSASPTSEPKANIESASPDYTRKAPATKPPKPVNPRIIEVPDSLKKYDAPKRTAPLAPPPEPKKPPVVKEEPKVSPKPIPFETSRESRVPDHSTSKYNGLFEFKSSSELADRLGDRPVANLTKALSINDRLLYMNQLFGKNMNELDQSLQLLNRFERIEEAKSIIITLAEQHNWLSEEKVDIAKDFIRLVRRRYL